MILRAATLDDATAIMEIYNREVTESMVTFDLVARSVDDQRRWLTDRAGVHAAVVAVDGETVVGFGSVSPYRDRPAYSTTVEDSVYVHREHQGRGVGREILADLVARAEQHGFHAMIARIVGGHEASINLHASLGFETVGHEREVGRKFGRWLDVIVMERLLS